ncbi:Non-specific lipid-transfer protein [Fusarium oxysporum f. sp. albedinis]|nr:Non-specific lipid-transfer protein [Fusarium oxysporum f. sp. albedinis]
MQIDWQSNLDAFANPLVLLIRLCHVLSRDSRSSHLWTLANPCHKGITPQYLSSWDGLLPLSAILVFDLLFPSLICDNKQLYSTSSSTQSHVHIVSSRFL